MKIDVKMKDEEKIVEIENIIADYYNDIYHSGRALDLITELIEDE